jgi:dephospho-CoA kinase
LTELAVGLTGGIGSGKSAVADLLVARGAVVVDADVVAREVVVPGGPAYQPLVDRFGAAIVAADGTIDRPALAAAAFADADALAALNAITHPAIGVAMLERRHALAGTDDVAVFAIPLFKPEHRQTMDLDAVVVVDCPVDVAIERLVARRGMDRDDAEARVAAQATRDERLAGADYVVDNGGSVDELAGEADRLWAWLLDRRRNG